MDLDIETKISKSTLSDIDIMLINYKKRILASIWQKYFKNNVELKTLYDDFLGKETNK